MPSFSNMEYPPIAFHFKVEVLGLESPVDEGFLEVSGIHVSRNYNNHSGTKDDKQLLYTPLVLKRAFPVQGSRLTNWTMRALDHNENYSTITYDVDVSLLDEKGNDLIKWRFLEARPIQWNISRLNAMENSILYETIELEYDYFMVI